MLTLNQSGYKCYDPIHRSDMSVQKLFVFDENTWFNIAVYDQEIIISK